MIEFVSHIGHTIKDMNKAVDLYTNLLGFQPDWPAPVPLKSGSKFFMLSLGGLHVELIEAPNLDEGLTKIAFRCDDLSETVKSLREKGIVVQDPRNVPFLAGSRMTFIDPKFTLGTSIELTEQWGPHVPK